MALRICLLLAALAAVAVNNGGGVQGAELWSTADTDVLKSDENKAAMVDGGEDVTLGNDEKTNAVLLEAADFSSEGEDASAALPATPLGVRELSRRCPALSDYWLRKEHVNCSGNTIGEPEGLPLNCCLEMCQQKAAFECFTYRPTDGRCTCKSACHQEDETTEFGEDCYIRTYPVLIVEGKINEIYVPIKEVYNSRRVWRAVTEKGNFKERYMYYETGRLQDGEHVVGWAWTAAGSRDIKAIAYDDSTLADEWAPRDGLKMSKYAWGQVNHAKAPLHTTCVPMAARRVFGSIFWRFGLHDSFMGCANQIMDYESTHPTTSDSWVYKAYVWHQTTHNCFAYKFDINARDTVDYVEDINDLRRVRPYLVCVRGVNWIPTNEKRSDDSFLLYHKVDRCMESVHHDHSRLSFYAEEERHHACDGKRVWVEEFGDRCTMDNGSVEVIQPIQEDWDNRRVTIRNESLAPMWTEYPPSYTPTYFQSHCGGQTFAGTRDIENIRVCTKYCENRDGFACAEASTEGCFCKKQCPLSGITRAAKVRGEISPMCKLRQMPVLIIYGKMNEVYVPTAKSYNSRNIWRAVDRNGDFKKRRMYSEDNSWHWAESVPATSGGILASTISWDQYSPADGSVLRGNGWGRVNMLKDPLYLACVPEAVLSVSTTNIWDVEDKDDFFACAEAGMAQVKILGVAPKGFIWNQVSKKCRVFGEDSELVGRKEFLDGRRVPVDYQHLACILETHWIPISDGPYQTITSVDMQSQCYFAAKTKHPTYTKVLSEIYGNCVAETGDTNRMRPVDNTEGNSKAAYFLIENMNPSRRGDPFTSCPGEDHSSWETRDAPSCAGKCVRYSRKCFEFKFGVPNGVNCHCKKQCLTPEPTSDLKLPFSTCYSQE